jgi:hypothetical protein
VTAPGFDGLANPIVEVRQEDRLSFTTGLSMFLERIAPRSSGVR